MLRTMLKSKIHRAHVTEANLNYQGSLTIDRVLLEAADIIPHEQVHIWNVTQGTRLTTYAIAGEAGSGVICANGGAAHLVSEGDIVIIATFVQMTEKELESYSPKVLFVDQLNRVQLHAEKEEPMTLGNYPFQE